MANTSEDVWQILAESERQISKFGAKFGGFTEGLALPSMEAVLREQFGIKLALRFSVWKVMLGIEAS